jgi:glyoxylase-like metal-dependent hydrolase (beta-lactamase superfamily II)
LLAAGPLAAADDAPAKYVHFVWSNPAPGVWHGVTPPASFIGSNTAIFKIPGGALVVDAHITESTAREIVAKAKEVAGPIKFLVNSHFHNDRSGGNFGIKKAFPDVKIIAHKNSCWAEREKALPRWKWRVAEQLGKDVEVIRANIAKVTDPKMKADLQRILAGNELYLEDSKTFTYVFPDVCLDLKPGESKTIVEGEREIQVMFPGGAHTSGDLVVLLPKEKIAFTGALWSTRGTAGCDGRDGSLLQCAASLRRVQALDFDLALPGGGESFRGKTGLAEAIKASEEFVQKVKASYERGEYIEKTLALLTPPVAPRGQPTLSDYVPYISVDRYGPHASRKRAIIRAYEELEFRKVNGMELP